MAIRVLKDGRIRVYWKEKGTGRQRSKNFPRGTEGMAAARMFESSLGLQKKRRRKPKGRTFADIAAEYMIHKQADNESITLQNLYYKLRGVILPEIGHIPINRLNAERMDRYVSKRLKTPVYKRTGGKKEPVTDPDGSIRTIKRTTVNREVTDIISILNWAVDRQYIAINPLARYKKPKRDDAEILPPTEAEARAVLAVAPDHLYRAILISYYTGIRPGKVELLSLRWDQVDWTRKTLTVISARKGGLRRRQIPLHPDFLTELKAWWATDEEKNGNIITYNGKPIGTIKKAFRTALEKAGIKRRLTPYSFRHAFATALLRAGGDLKSTSELLGHTRTDTTTRVYQHTDSMMHRDAVNRLPSLASKKGEKVVSIDGYRATK